MIILMVSMVIVFLIIPIFAYTFEHLLLEILYQDIADQLELSTYFVYQKLDPQSLSRQVYVVDEDLLDLLNESLNKIEHPQLIRVAADEMFVSQEEISFYVTIELRPSLYRILDFVRFQKLQYDFALPMDGD